MTDCKFSRIHLRRAIAELGILNTQIYSTVRTYVRAYVRTYARTRAVMAGANQFQVNPNQPKGSPGGSDKTPTDPNTTTTILNGSAAVSKHGPVWAKHLLTWG